MNASGPPRKNSVCFYWRTSSGLSGWLSQKDVDYLIDYVLTYDDITVYLQPDIYRDEAWYGIRLKAIKKETRSFVINETTTLTKVISKEADTFYYFKTKEIRDKVIQSWTE
jgi:hypothetical protein